MDENLWDWQSVGVSFGNYLATAIARLSLPTPGSTTTTCTVPAGK